MTERRLDDIPVEDLEVPVRAYNVLKNMLVHSVGHLSRFSKQDILRQKNAGKVTLADIETALVPYGVKLRDERDPKEAATSD